jgi:amino acid transporter
MAEPATARHDYDTARRRNGGGRLRRRWRPTVPESSDREDTKTLRGEASRTHGADTPQEGVLRGHLGTSSIVLTVVGYLAPLGAAAGYLPLVVGYGNGLGAPWVFLLAGVVLLLFAFGYTALVRHVPQPGAFYAYITAGLGKRVGLGAGALTLTVYFLGAVGFYVFGGLQAQSLVRDRLGVDLPWWVYVAGFIIIVGATSYRGIDFNARVLGIIVALEVLLILAFDAATLLRGGPSGYATESFTWQAFTSGSVAVAALFAITVYAGFEATAIFKEEAANPSVTIPRATYIVVVSVSVFYFLTVWCLITALGADKAPNAAAADPSGAFNLAMDTILGHAAGHIVSVLILTSVIASEMAIANVSTRYVYSFGIDRVLPPVLGKTHPRHGSPHRASLAVTAVAVVGIAAVAISGVEPHVAYGVIGGVGVFGFEVLMLLVSLAAIIYFRRNPNPGLPVWSTLIAPILSVLSFGWLLCYSIGNSELLLGAPTLLTPIVFAIMVGAFALGLLWASRQATKNPELFARIGRVDM